MKLLKTDGTSGLFLRADGEYALMEKINKDELLRLVNLTLTSEGIEFDPYDESTIKNQAHRVIYRSVHKKLAELQGRRKEFLDESARQYLSDYERYKNPVTP